ncbi:hypothetical protein Fmac_010846 [Flemingia macrophylla]|uniref:Uncharacterized protein n=1 Tax=Flemingia macrophylla TaxID=520843 RepID=A0ABD1MKR6_9FABA
MLLMGVITNSIILNWVYVISDNMLKTRRLMDYKCPFVLLVSRLTEHYNIDTEGEARELTKEAHDVKDKALMMMRLVKTLFGWMPNEDVPPDADEPPEDVPHATTAADTPLVAAAPDASPTATAAVHTAAATPRPAPDQAGPFTSAPSSGPKPLTETTRSLRNYLRPYLSVWMIFSIDLFFYFLGLLVLVLMVPNRGRIS